MLAVLLASLSALSYGGSDFSGAIGSKHVDSIVVTFVAQIVSLATLLLVLIVLPADERTAVDLAWGALGGLGAAVALVTLYRALALGPMSTVAATTALVSVVVPVIAAFALGDRPSAITLLGIGIAIPAAVLVSVGGTVVGRASIVVSPRLHTRRERAGAETRALSIVSGLGFALFFVALSRVSEDSGLFPLLGARGASIALLTIVLLVQRSRPSVPREARWPVLAAGVLDCAANAFYLLALGEGAFIWVAAITSMYPVSTVLLARIVLHERLQRLQFIGIGGAALALVLITVGAEV